jgi:hypothetical protein
MTQVTTAGRLLAQLYGESEGLGDAIAAASGIQLDRAHGAASGTTPLTLSEQLRLSEATTLLAPRFTRQALRLRGQVLAAHSYERGDVLARADSPTERWERSSLLRR